LKTGDYTQNQIVGEMAIFHQLRRPAADLGATEATIKVHRASLMRKMQADSLAELVKMVARLNLPGSNP